MAHARRSFRGRGISESQRRKKLWGLVTGPVVSSDGSGTATQTPNMVLELPGNVGGNTTEATSAGLVSDPLADNIPAESTILRIRGSVNLPKNSLTTSGNDYFAMGIAVMEGTAAKLGAFPNPATPEGGSWDGWMFYRSQQAGALDANATLIDVKSMRKVPSGDSVIIVFGRFSTWTAGNLPAGSSIQMQMNLRQLILLP